MTTSNNNIPERDQQFDTEYIGNVWGWKFSLFGLVLILGLSLAMCFRHESTGTEPGFEKMEHPVDKVFDNN